MTHPNLRYTCWICWLCLCLTEAQAQLSIVQVTPSESSTCTGTIHVQVDDPSGPFAIHLIQEQDLIDAVSIDGGAALFENVCAGSYHVQLTNGFNCQSLTPVTISSCAPISVSHSVSTSCSNEATGRIDVQVADGSAYYYYWNTGATSQDLYNVSAGNYVLTITDPQHCEETFVFVVPSQGIHIAVASVQGVGSGTSGSIDVDVSGTHPPFSYLWSNGATTEDLTDITESDRYRLTVTDALGCAQVLDDVLIPSCHSATTITAAIDLSEEVTLCRNGTAGAIGLTFQGGQNPYTVDWEHVESDWTLHQFIEQEGSSTIYKAMASDLSRGLYRITVTDACQNSATLDFELRCTEDCPIEELRDLLNYLVRTNNECLQDDDPGNIWVLSQVEHNFLIDCQSFETPSECTTFDVFLEFPSGTTYRYTDSEPTIGWSLDVEEIVPGSDVFMVEMVSNGSCPLECSLTTAIEEPGQYTMTMYTADGCFVQKTFSFDHRPPVPASGLAIDVLPNGIEAQMACFACLTCHELVYPTSFFFDNIGPACSGELSGSVLLYEPNDRLNPCASGGIITCPASGQSIEVPPNASFTFFEEPLVAFFDNPHCVGCLFSPGAIPDVFPDYHVYVETCIPDWDDPDNPPDIDGGGGVDYDDNCVEEIIINQGDCTADIVCVDSEEDHYVIDVIPFDPRPCKQIINGSCSVVGFCEDTCTPFIWNGDFFYFDEYNCTDDIPWCDYLSNCPGSGTGTLALHQNQPNPWVDMTNIPFEIPTSGNVHLFILTEDHTQQIIEHEASYDEGLHTWTIQEDQLPAPGVYSYFMAYDGQVLSRNMILLSGFQDGGDASSAFVTSAIDLSDTGPRVRIFPNPFQHQLHIEITMASDMPTWEVQLYDILGRQVYSAQWRPSSRSRSLHTIELPETLRAGVYYTWIRSSNGWSKQYKLVHF